MTPEILLVLGILALTIVLLVTEWIPMEVTALLVLGVLAVSGLVDANQALSGFSNPAVVTIWAVFILSGGLTRTGVAGILGRYMLRLAGSRQATLVVVIMAGSGILSAVMNNVAVAALLLPVVMDLARQTGHPPSKLLMPLAYGSLLGGLTTQIGTPPNILVSAALKDSGLIPFSFFDFTPLGLAVMASGIFFMAVLGRRLLPSRDVFRDFAASRKSDLCQQYGLQNQVFSLSVPLDSILEGRTLAQSRMGSILGLNVIGVIRGENSFFAPGPEFLLKAGDRLLVEGEPERLGGLEHWTDLDVGGDDEGLKAAVLGDLQPMQVVLGPDSPLIGRTVYEMDLYRLYGVTVLAVAGEHGSRVTGLQDSVLRVGDRLLLQADGNELRALAAEPGFQNLEKVSVADLDGIFNLQDNMLMLRVSKRMPLAEQSLAGSRIGDALGMRVLRIVHQDGRMERPGEETVIQSGARLVLLGRTTDLELIRGLGQLHPDADGIPSACGWETEDVGMMEAALSPHTTLAGKTPRQLHFREKYGLNLLAVWREGRPHTSGLRDLALRLGDALLVFGPRDKLRILGQEPDYLVLTESVQEVPRRDKTRTALLIMSVVLLPVLLGWVPIYISAVMGAAAMVLFRCLTMEEAYRYIEWKAVFLIAGLLPLGVALDQTGTAGLLAERLVQVVGPYGPMAVLAGILAMTFLATCIIPTAALVVLMVPIILNTSAQMGISPYGLMMGMAMAASSSFMTPISHPANILVMGLGGYRFADYLKAGLPLTLVIMAVIVLLLPLLWPLTP